MRLVMRCLTIYSSLEQYLWYLYSSRELDMIATSKGLDNTPYDLET